MMRRNILAISLVTFTLALVATSLQTPAHMAAPGGGSVEASAQVPYTLYGSFTDGWGTTSTTITQPGPTIYIDEGDTIVFSLYAEDSVAHILVIDFDRDGSQDTGEPASGQFSSPTTATTFSWLADRDGTFQYYCGVHGAGAQNGTLVVNASSAPPPAPAGDNTLLIVGGIVVVVVVVAAAAVMMRRKPKGPAQPPSP